MNLCDECPDLTGCELPAPPRTISNSSIDGTLMMERCMADTHDSVSNLPDLMDAEAVHGATRTDGGHYCVPCKEWRLAKDYPHVCKCGAPWVRP